MKNLIRLLFIILLLLNNISCNEIGNGDGYGQETSDDQTNTKSNFYPKYILTETGFTCADNNGNLVPGYQKAIQIEDGEFKLFSNSCDNQFIESIPAEDIKVLDKEDNYATKLEFDGKVYIYLEE